MKSKRLLLLLLMALIAPWAMNAQNSIPFNEGFESMTSVDDLTAAGWTLSTTESGTFLAIETGASNVYEGAKSLNLDAWDASSSSSVQYLGLPLMAGNLNTLQISFAYKVTSGTIDVGYLTNATDFSTFTSLVQYSSSSSFTVKTTDLSTAPTNAARLVLKYTGWYRCYLDSFEVKALPSCQAATSITASDITATSATIAWEGEGNTWNLKYNGIEVNGISAMSYNLTSLTDGTNYTVSVQNVCSDGTTTDWISTTFRTPEICPDGKICIGEGTTTSTYLPTYNFYNYSLTEQIYTAEEIGQAGAILSVDIYSVGTVTRTLEFYMVSTEKETFTDGTDWIAATASDLLYSGSMTFAANSWNTIEFDNPFIYDGRSNVALIVRDMTGSYESGIPFYVFDAPGQAIYKYQDAGAFGLDGTYNGTVQTGTVANVKNRVRLGMGEPPACPKPTGLAVDYQGGTEATISWTSDATAWNMRVNGTPINGTITNPFTLTGLELATTYEVEVQANCGDATSEWAGPVSFTTDACMPENMCEITYELADSYGDGWNGNYINVVDVETEAIIATWTISSGSSASGTLAICDGRAIQFQYVYPGGYTYPDENSWVITDVNGEVIWEYESPTASMSQDYTMSCTVTTCRKPTDLATAEVGPRSAVLSWTENGEATAWQVEVTDLDGGQITTWNANATTFEIVGLTPDTRYSVRVKPDCEEEKWSDAITFRTDVACPAPTALEVVPTPISATVTWTGDASNYNLRYGTCAGADATLPAIIVFHADDIWQDGSGYQMLLDADATAYGTIIPETGALSMNCSGNEDIYAEFEYKIPANADGSCSTSNVVIDNTITLEIPAGTYDWCITNPTPGDRIWIASNQGSVGGRKDDYEFEGGMIYEFNMYMLGSNDATDVTITCNNVAWTTVNDVTSPYTIDGLDPETEYTVAVQAVCGGEDGQSAWTSTSFTTPSNCDAPTALNVTNLMPTTATLNWTGYQDGFEVWYRPVAQGAELASIDFEDSSMGSWTTIDADGDGYDWVLGSACDGIYLNGGNLAGTGRNDSQDLVVSGSYSNVSGALTPDNYLVSPQVELGGSITFWAAAQDASYAAEVFGVAVSTTSNTDASAFTTIQSWTMTSKGRYINDGSCRTMPIKTRSVLTRSGNRAGGTWYQYTVDLSAYAGQTGYVAIRHYDCTDQFMLDVDDITINGPATEEQEWTMVTTDATSYNAEGLEPETTYEWQVRGENRSCGEDGVTAWSEMGTFTTPGECDPLATLLIDELTPTSITLSWTGYQESYNVRYRTPADADVFFYEDFSGESIAFTFDNFGAANNDFGYASGWYEFTDGTDAIIFFPDTELTSPQYLVSTEMEPTISGTTIEFGAAATATGCVYRLGFSSTDNNISSFTWSEDIAIENSYVEYEVPVGTKYFAIAYPETNPSTAYAYVMDFMVYANYVPAGEWVTFEGVNSPFTIDGLTPETEYEVYVQGVCGEDETTVWLGGYFTTPAFIQTIELTEGWNWFSTYVELDDPVELLNRLQEGLGDTGIQIENVIEGVNMNVGDGYWAGDLDGTGLLNEHMYMIEVSEGITVELQGPATNPESHEITLYPEDFSWIGFPCAEEVDVNVALAGLEAEDGDYIENDKLGVIYYYGEWMGDFDTMIPGRGYLYYSNSSDEKTLIFQTGETKARHFANVSKLQPAKKQAFVKQNLKIQKTISSRKDNK